MPVLTIFTATYNRGHLITRIYDALLKQSNFDFEWLVVDDGSTDNTEEIFRDLLSRKHPFNIRYYQQENKGLIRSLNKGIELALGRYLSKIDSDDYPLDTFVSDVMRMIAEIKNVPHVYAVGGLRVSPDGIPLKRKLPNFTGYVDATDLERVKYGIDADMSEAWSLDILRKYPFPVWPNEKFSPEQIVLHQIALDGYRIRWYAKPLVVCEYQIGGLTLGTNRLQKENPMGYSMMFNQRLRRKDLSCLERIKTAANHIALSIVGGNPKYILRTNDKIATILSFIPGVLLSWRRKKQYKDY